MSGGTRALVGRCLVVAAAALSAFGAAFLIGKSVLNVPGPPYWWRRLGSGGAELTGHRAVLVAAALARGRGNRTAGFSLGSPGRYEMSRITLPSF